MAQMACCRCLYHTGPSPHTKLTMLVRLALYWPFSQLGTLEDKVPHVHFHHWLHRYKHCIPQALSYIPFFFFSPFLSSIWKRRDFHYFSLTGSTNWIDITTPLGALWTFFITLPLHHPFVTKRSDTEKGMRDEVKKPPKILIFASF